MSHTTLSNTDLSRTHQNSRTE
ncbi:MAG: hypothetical protein ACKO7W_19315 [Elainella sp.]